MIHISQPSAASQAQAPPAGRRHAITALAAIACIALVVAGCGGGSSSPGPGPSPATFTAAAFKYAGCMRDHGLPNFPDPSVTDHNGQPVAYLGTSDALRASPAFKTADKACQKILAPTLDTAQNPAEQAAREQHMIAFAKCMRSHGVPGFPDPTTQGQLTQQMITGAGVDLHAPAVFAAAKACLPSAGGAISAQQVESAVWGTR